MRSIIEITLFAILIIIVTSLGTYYFWVDVTSQKEVGVYVPMGMVMALSAAIAISPD